MKTDRREFLRGCAAKERQTLTNATLRGKPDAGNPHVAPSQCYGGTGRFEEREVAPAATPRRGARLYRTFFRLAVLCGAMASELLAADFTISGYCPSDDMATQAFARTETNQTEKIQRAIDDAFLSGGGTVTLGTGLHLVKGIRLRSCVRLHLAANAILCGSRNAADYDILSRDRLEPFDPDAFPSVHEAPTKGFAAMMKPGARYNNAIIRIVNARDVSLTGDAGSVIDGANSYDPHGESGFRGVHGISVSYSTNVLFSGYTLQHAGNWGHRIDHAVGVRCEHVTVLAGHDGFHVRHCDDVTVSDCRFHTGDDSIAGYDNLNVVVRRCDLSSACQAFRFGGTNVLIEECVAHGPCKYVFRGSIPPQAQRDGLWDPAVIPGRHSMAAFFVYFSSDRCPIRQPPGNIVVRNCRIENAARLLRYDFQDDGWQRGHPLTDICFTNVTAKGLQLPIAASAGPASCKSLVPLELYLVDCKLSFSQRQTELVAGRNIGRLVLRNVDVQGVDGPALRMWEGHADVMSANVTGARIEQEPGTGKYRCLVRPLPSVQNK